MSIRTLGAFPKDRNANTISIACAQVLPSENGMLGAEGGLKKLAEYAAKAASLGADVIVFPEYFLTGATHDMWRAVRQDSDGEGKHPDRHPDHFLNTIGRTAKECDIDILAGTVVELGLDHVPHRAEASATDDDDKHDQKLFNTVYYVDRTGKVAGRYTKRVSEGRDLKEKGIMLNAAPKNLWHPEREVLSPGHELRHEAPKTFEITTKAGTKLRAGVAWDIAFPETFREMFDVPAGDQGESNPLIGPDIVFAPTCWYATDAGQKGLKWNKDSEAVLLDSICITRAIENECILVMTNIAGAPFPTGRNVSELSESDAIGVGRTCVCAPFAGCVRRIEDGDEALLLASVDVAMLHDARQIYRCRYDLRRAWCSELK